MVYFSFCLSVDCDEKGQSRTQTDILTQKTSLRVFIAKEKSASIFLFSKNRRLL